MLAYVARRLLLIIPTLVGIMLLNFLIVQAAPGGPVEQIISQLKGKGVGATARVGGSSGSEAGGVSSAPPGADSSRGARGIDPALIKQLEKQFGLDKPVGERFLLMMKNYLVFDFGNSFYRDRSVAELVIEKLPVSISLGLWSTFLIYFISIPLGIAKAVRDGSRFDVATSMAVIVGYAVPAFLFGILLIVLFAGGTFLNWFPLRGIVSENWSSLSPGGKILDYFWHMALPTTAMVVGGFASLTMLTKNSFMDEIHKQYVTTARAKGLSEQKILYGHVFRNAMLIVVAGFPAAFVSIFFTGSLLIEVIFSLDGLGLLGFEAAISRDYPVMFGTLYFFTLLGLVMNLVSDLTYMFIDPRIDFEKREG
ncbi:microcin C ABC transporter permease YejB [bacterium]|nr:MAG: microcin C ABC transporter permease YejB [bacterium]